MMTCFIRRLFRRETHKEFMSKDKPYLKPIEHIADELKRIDIMFEIFRFRTGRKNDDEKDIYSGLFISEKKVDTLLGRDNNTVENSSTTLKLKEILKRLEDVIDQRLNLSKKNGNYIPLERLKDKFKLESFEVDMLLICLAPSVDAQRYEKLYGYVHDDMTRKYPTLDLVFTLLTENLEKRIEKERFCSNNASLFRWQILTFGRDHDHRTTPLHSIPLCVDERIVDFVLGVSRTVSLGLNVLNRFIL